MPFEVIAQIAVSGAFMGLVYALVAYGFQLTYATSKSLNGFAPCSSVGLAKIAPRPRVAYH